VPRVASFIVVIGLSRFAILKDKRQIYMLIVPRYLRGGVRKQPEGSRDERT